MNILELDAIQVVRKTRQYLGISSLLDELNPLDDAFLAASIRRQVSFQCPCSPALLTSCLRQSLSFLSEDVLEDSFKERLDSTLENLIIIGDVLELHNVITMDSNVKGAWLFAAPPAFVMHPQKEKIYILGIARDDLSALPESLNQRVQFKGALRFLTVDKDENLSQTLLQLGLRELSWDSWHKLPKQENAQEFLRQMQHKLSRQETCSDTLEIEILDPEIQTQSYKKRWCSPKSHTGKYIARRPQEYGAHLWGYVELIQGKPARFLDLPLKGSRLRGCDTAWQVQLAIDCCRNNPQTYSSEPVKDGALLKFYSPLPMWAQRRLAIIGDQEKQSDCLFAYHLTSQDVIEEERFLQNRLWLHRGN